MKLRRANDGSYLFHCPGCDGYHFFDKRWSFNGNLDLPTFTPSLLVRGSCGAANTSPTAVCHSFITDGRIQYLGDCTHALAGQTVEMSEED